MQLRMTARWLSAFCDGDLATISRSAGCRCYSGQQSRMLHRGECIADGANAPVPCHRGRAIRRPAHFVDRATHLSQDVFLPGPGASTLPEPPPLDKAVIENWLVDAELPEPIEVEVAVTTGSTNEDLLACCRRRRLDAARLRAADEQTAGRGRQRRPWLARPRSALLFSIAVPLGTLPTALPAITLACGTALADDLITRGAAVRLKWPNDVLLDGRKLAGVLCELAVDPDGCVTLVIGVGINGWLSEEDRARIDQPAAALSEVVSASLLAGQREAWIAALAGTLLQTARRFAHDGFTPWRARFNELLHARGEVVDIVDDGSVVTSGRIIEVDAIGRLVLAAAGGHRVVSVGDVSMRIAPSGPSAI
jgi:BirA family biotin operon repressor/biotin-[acetyl-CoA-carboxylase] ligase